MLDVQELYRRICSVTTAFDFADPVTEEDCAAVRDALCESIGSGQYRVLVGVLVNGRVLVEVWDQLPRIPARVYAREFLVVRGI